MLASIYLWIGIFIIQPHKEERFMYVIYPLICYNAAYAVCVLEQLLEGFYSMKLGAKTVRALTRIFPWGLVIVYAVLSLARILAQVRAFTAPMYVFAEVTNPSIVCLGKEWYRFPSSFFLPEGSRAFFVKSAFSGLLPGRFLESETLGWRSGMWQIPTGMNDRNLEEMSHMVKASGASSHIQGSPRDL
jgi:alpha-1,2-mannosyltransferase